MKTLTTTALFSSLFILPLFIFAQNPDLPVFGGESSMNHNDANHPCITAEQYTFLENECNENIKNLKLPANEKVMVPLSWPLKPSVNMTDCGYYFISAYADHNATAGAIQDYNCGAITYDGHKGTDIAIWPYSFYKVDNNMVEVIAAADGIIIAKNDGQFDRNCDGSNPLANYVVLQHADGSRTNYWHMKNGSITLKAVGEALVTGEHVGFVASSGSSSGPHLHFEVWSGNTAATLVDPYAGGCNSWNASSYWVAQKPHAEPALLKTSVHTTDVVFPACPLTEPISESATYTIPFQGAGLPAGFAKFYIFLRNETAGTVVDMSIHKPDGSLQGAAWQHVCNSDIKVACWGYSKLLPTIPGIYTFVANYNGVSCTTSFEISNPAVSGLSEFAESSSLKAYPNPTKGLFTVEGNAAENETFHFDLKNVFGQVLFSQQENVIDATFQKSIDISNLPNGFYFLEVSNEKGSHLLKINKTE